MIPRSAVFVPVCLAILASSPAAASAPAADDAYRAFVRSPPASHLLTIARDAMRRHWGERTTGAPRDAADISWPAAPRGVYFSLTDGLSTRACVGSVTPYRGGLVQTVRALAVQSLQADRRRPPIRREELPDLRIIISFAGVGESVADPMQVDPGREGLLISSSGGSVAFLPGEARTVAWALREARRIGVLRGPLEGAAFYRFPVVVLAEAPPPVSQTPPPSQVENPNDSP
jgi:AMMECR1 domain-containing protein